MSSFFFLFCSAPSFEKSTGIKVEDTDKIGRQKRLIVPMKTGSSELNPVLQTFNLANSVRHLLSQDVCEQLDLEGYAVLNDQPFPAPVAAELLREVQHCFHNIDGGKVPNQVELLTSDGPIKLTKPNIYERDLYNQSVRQQLPFFNSLFHGPLGQLVEVLREKVSCCEDLVPFETAAEAARSVTLKLQMNEGGAFPWHYDNPGSPNRRRLTMAVYLTEQWSSEVGGELQLMPFLGPCISVAPQLATVVLFRSDLVLHRVRPFAQGCKKVRYCFTIWFDGTATNSHDDLLLRVNHLQETSIPFLKRSPVQRVLSRAVYEEAYRASLEDCFGRDTVSAKVSLREHQAHLTQLLQNSKVRDFVEVLREYRVDDGL